ncbi:MAG: T9SS type A sorting domain-containing protein [bacterium]
MIRTVLTSLLLCLTVAAGWQNLRASSLESQRLARHQARSLSGERKLDPGAEEHRSAWGVSILGSAEFSDSKIFSDQYPANFAQRYPDLAHFSDGNGLAVWEDQRNGDWDIFGQMFAPDGGQSGGNLDLLSDPDFHNQRQPRVAVDGTDHLALVWTEEEDAGVYAAVFDDGFSMVAAAVRLDDAGANNSTNLPAVAGLSGGGFVVVWEDVRFGANIYGQLLGANGALIGSNFLINENISSPTRLAPAVCGDLSGNFAVVWEDSRDGESDVFFRAFNSSHVPLTSDLEVADVGFADSYQFSGQVGFVSDGYFVALWVSDRNAEQGLYGQLISAAGSFSGANFQINSASTDVCWDPSAKRTSDGGTAVSWTNLSGMATIDYAFLDPDGSVALSGEAQDESEPGERGVPALCWSASGGQAVWMDERDFNQDIYAQQFDAGKSLSGTNELVNHDVLGSQQLSPEVAALPDGKVAVVWQDQRDDAGDIYLQITNLSGSPAVGALRLNDDLYRATQQAPCVGASTQFGILVLWEDDRELEGEANKKIMGQHLSLSGSKTGANFLVSDNPGGNAESAPAVGVSSEGYALAIWTEESTPAKTILLQGFSPSGAMLGGNSTLITPVGASDNREPRVGLRADVSGVATWTAVFGGRRTQFFQRLQELELPEGDPTMVALDTSQSQVLAADLFVHNSTGEFYIVVVDSQLAGTAIKLFRYDGAGAQIGGAATVASSPGAGVDDLCLTGDVDDALLVSWSQVSGGKRQAFGRLMHRFGYALGGTFPLSNGDALETNPAVAMLSGQYFAVWCDNRTPGYGFDLYANSVLYTSAAAEDDLLSLPGSFSLRQNYPNPFNPSTTISYTLQQPGRVRLEVFNLLGERVVTLLDCYQKVGDYAYHWNATEQGAGRIGSGVYFYRLATESGALTRKMIYLK